MWSHKPSIVRRALLWGCLVVLLASCGHSSSETPPQGSDVISDVPAMVTVPSGTFKMGWDNLTGHEDVVAPYPQGLYPGPSGPVRLVRLSRDFKIGKYEITNAQYADMLNYALRKGYLSGDYQNNITVKNREGNSQELLNLDADYEGKQCDIYFDGMRFVVKPGLENHPVVYVSWYGAAFYCNILSEWKGLEKLYNLADWSCTFNGAKKFYGYPGFRLPTEAEWEHAARYDADNMVYDRRPVPWETSSSTYAAQSSYGTDLSYFLPYANFKSGEGTKAVGSYEAGKSLLGIYDMTGNVSEWAQDYYSSYTYFAPYQNEVDPNNDTSGVYRQKRGGSWLVYANNFPLTTYHTDTNWPYTSYCDMGFRIMEVLP